MKLRLAVIGTGMAWERLHWPAIRQMPDKYEIVALCDKTADKAKQFAKQINLSEENIYSDYSELLKRNDIDVVDILVPISENFEVAKDVILAGKNLIAEKPLAATLEGAKELIALKDEKQVKMMVAENFCYEECSTVIKGILSEGKIGEVAYFILNTAAGFEKDMLEDTFGAKEWRQHPNFKGGIFLDGGIHDIALLRFLFGEVQTVTALAAKHQKDYCPYRNINTVLRFSNNIIGSYNYWSSGTELAAAPVGLRIFGSAGEIYLESKECGFVRVQYNNGQSEQRTFTPGKGYYNELLGFYNGEIRSAPETEINDMKLLFQILESIQ